MSCVQVKLGWFFLNSVMIWHSRYYNISSNIPYSFWLLEIEWRGYFAWNMYLCIWDFLAIFEDYWLEMWRAQSCLIYSCTFSSRLGCTYSQMSNMYPRQVTWSLESNLVLPWDESYIQWKKMNITPLGIYRCKMAFFKRAPLVY